MTQPRTLIGYIQTPKAPWSSLLIVPAGTKATALVTAPVGFALRMIDGGGVRLDGEKLSDKGRVLAAGETVVLQVGKRKFARVRLF